jgi:transcriptional regulator with XRE-family HTH domain
MSRNNEIVAEEVAERKGLWAAVRRAEPIQQVRRLMRQKELLNKDMAQRMGISEAGISRLLNGNQNIQIDTLFMLADALEEPLSIEIGQKELGLTYSFDEGMISSYFIDADDIGAGGSNVVQLSSYKKGVREKNSYPRTSGTFDLICANT